MQNRKGTSWLILLAFLWVGCQDLAVENDNLPDGVPVASDPTTIEALGAATFATNWQRQWCGESMMLQTMADANSSAWPNWGMRDMSSEPRTAWNNDPAYSWSESIRRPWLASYRAITNANDVLRAIATAEDGGDGLTGIDVPRLHAFSKFNQAWAHAYLALLFDQAFIVDESIDLEAAARGDVALTLRPYQEVMVAALMQMDEAIALANANNFVISAAEDWVFGLDFTSEDLVRLGKSFKAQWMALVARTPAERDAANWNEIIDLSREGITGDFAPIGDDAGELREWDCMKFYFSNGIAWARIDYRMLGPADESGGYALWEATPLQNRGLFDLSSSDRRVVGGDGSNPRISGKYTQFQGTNGPFPAVHGTYHFSSHNHSRWQAYSAANATGPMHFMLVTELDLLIAEGLLRTGGDLQEVAELINKTRVANGELTPATSNDNTGDPSDAQSHTESASLWAKLKHEKRWETLSTSSGLEFFDDRGWGDLVSGTPIHFPVPGVELETLGLQLYTFGAGGEGSAGKRVVSPRLEIPIVSQGF